MADVFDDRAYTLDTLVEELALTERHIRDGSWRVCDCIPEKHLPLISGLASEGYLFAKGLDERKVMATIRDMASGLRDRLREGLLRDEDMNLVAELARIFRHRLDEFGATEKPCPICQSFIPKNLLDDKQTIQRGEESTLISTPSNPFRIEEFGWVGFIVLPAIMVGVWLIENWVGELNG